MTSPQATLGEIAARRLAAKTGKPARSLIQGARAAAALYTLAVTTEKLGRFPSRAEHAAEWGESERNVTREWALIRDAFGGESLEQLTEWLVAQRALRRASNEAQTFSLVAPAWLAAA